jgi:crotonobetainyl-CoA:carnitine CoA-transferase CaiB-like acyl-CoA transferase
MSGWYRLTGDLIDPEGPPVRPAEWHGDLDPALFAVVGILGALFHRERTGEGQLVDVSQLDCMIAQNGIPITGYLLSGMVPWEMRAKYGGLRFYGAFKALDGWVFIHTSPRMVDRLKRGMGVETLEDVEELERWVTQRNVQDVVDNLSRTGVPVAPIYGIEEIVDDPQVNHRGVIVSVEHPEAGTVKSPNFPVKFSRTLLEVKRPAPLLGQHNNEVLAEVLGYDMDKIEDLRECKVIT